MNKMITYYETKLSKILPLYLIPNRNPNFTITQEIFYRDLIREIYSCLTYKTSLDPASAKIMITKMYKENFQEMKSSPLFISMVSQELINQL